MSACGYHMTAMATGDSGSANNPKRIENNKPLTNILPHTSINLQGLCVTFHRHRLSNLILSIKYR